MANWILTQKGTVIPQRLICWLTKDEYSESNEVEVAKRAVFNSDITKKLGDSINFPLTALPEIVKQDWDDELYDDDDDETPLEPFEADIVDAVERLIMMHSLTDVLINVEVLLDNGDSAALAQVVCQAVDSDGKVIGKWDLNPILNTMV